MTTLKKTQLHRTIQGKLRRNEQHILHRNNGQMRQKMHVLNPNQISTGHTN